MVVPVFVFPEGDEPDAPEDCDGSGPVVPDPEPPQPASAVMTRATASVDRVDPG